METIGTFSCESNLVRNGVALESCCQLTCLKLVAIFFWLAEAKMKNQSLQGSGWH